MYKVDIKTLKDITKLLDKISSPSKVITSADLVQAEKLSQHIKNNYTQIKPQ